VAGHAILSVEVKRNATLVGAGDRMSKRWAMGIGLVLLAMIGACAEQPARPSVVIVKKNPVSPKWQGITTASVSGVRNTYVQVVSAPAERLFPASLAIARVRGDLKSPDGPVIMASTPSRDLVDWMDLFDDVPMISEVFPVTFARGGKRPVRPTDVIEHAGEGGADLCLIYRETAHDEHEADVRGAIYATSNGQLLALVQADATSPRYKKDNAPSPPEGRRESDRRHLDARFIARERFLNNARACVLDWLNQRGGGAVAKAKSQRGQRVMLGSARP